MVISYLFDTSTIIDLGQRHYPRDLFSDLWNHIYSKIGNGDIIISSGVIKEIRDKINDTSTNRNLWRDDFINAVNSTQVFHHGNYQHVFKDIANKCQISNDYRGNKQQSAVGRFLQKADVWLISIAKKEGFTIVTGEKEGSLKIPTICKLEGVQCIDKLDYFRSQGMIFRS